MPARTPSREALLLAALVVALVAVVVYQFRGQGIPVGSGQPSSVRLDPVRAAAARDRVASVSDVRLFALKARTSTPVTPVGRNPFREPPKAPPAPPAGAASARAPDANLLPVPSTPPPITLKLVAIVQGAGRPVAALSDGRDVFYGREGDVIEGRYKIIKINVESIDISYVDGRGQRRLGLTG